MREPVATDDEQQQVVEQEIEEFESEEARQAYLRARRRRLIAAGLFCAVCVGVFCVTAYKTWRKTHPAGEDRRMAAQPLHIDPVGDPNAKIKIECILPSETGCHASIIKLLQDVAKRFPDKIYARFQSMGAMGGKAVTEKVGQMCAGVVINGNVHFELKDKKGHVREVNLVGTAPAHFSLQDVVDALTQVYTEVYGPPEKPLKPDWDLQPSSCAAHSPTQKASQKESSIATDLPPAENLPLKIDADR